MVRRKRRGPDSEAPIRTPRRIPGAGSTNDGDTNATISDDTKDKKKKKEEEEKNDETSQLLIDWQKKDSVADNIAPWFH